MAYRESNGHISLMTSHDPEAAGRGGEGGMRPGRHYAGAEFGGEFGKSASGKLAFALQNGFGDFDSRLQWLTDVRCQHSS